MDDLFKRYDKKVVEVHEAQRAFLNTLGLIKDLQAGTYTLEQIVVEDNGWKFVPDKEDESVS